MSIDEELDDWVEKCNKCKWVKVDFITGIYDCRCKGGCNFKEYKPRNRKRRVR